jgi:hypothetical protein
VFVVDLRIFFFSVDSAFGMWSLLGHIVSCSTILAFSGGSAWHLLLCAKERPPNPFHGAASQYDEYLVRLLLATKSLGIPYLTKRDHKLFAEELLSWNIWSNSGIIPFLYVGTCNNFFCHGVCVLLQ